MYALSTIAMTAYNLLALAGGTMADEALRQRCQGVQLPGLDAGSFIEALVEMAAKGWVDYDRGSKQVDLKDPHCRLVKYRDRSDGGYDDDGNPVGGWGGWRVQCRRQGMISIDDVINEVAA